MNIDRYTKSVLTIIAVCQCIMVFRETPIIKDAIAQNLDPIHVTVDSVRNSALRDAGPIEVRCIAGCKQFSGEYTDIDTYLFPGFSSFIGTEEDNGRRRNYTYVLMRTRLNQTEVENMG